MKLSPVMPELHLTLKSQTPFWKQICKQFGPRQPSSRLGSWVSSTEYNRARDTYTPRTPTELKEIRERLHKSEKARQSTEIFG